MVKFRHIRKFFKEFDVFAAPATLRSKEEPNTQSLCAGIFSLILILIFFYIFISRTIGIATFESIDSKQNLGRLSDEQLQPSTMMFAVGFQYFYAQSLYLTLEVEKCELNITKMDSFTNSTDFSSESSNGSLTDVEDCTPIKMEKCNPELWKGLGKNYQNELKDKFAESFLCPEQSQVLEVQNQTEIIKSFVVRLVKNNDSFTESSDYYEDPGYWIESYAHQLGRETLEFSIFLLDNTVDAAEKEPFRAFLNTDTKIYLDKDIGTFTVLQFSTYQVTTDFGLTLFEEEKVQSKTFLQKTFTTAYSIETKKNDFRNPYLEAAFSMSRNKVSIERSVGKIDDMLEDLGGLLEVIILFLAFFLMSYSRYKYELIVAEGAFNFSEEGRKIKAKDFHFFKYIKYCIYDWVNTLTCCSLNWKDCKEIDDTRKEANITMDVTRLFNKIRSFEVSFLYLMEPSQNICLKLIEPFSLETTRKNRLIADYYDAVIQGKEAITIEDVRIMKKKKGMMNEDGEKMPIYEEESEEMDRGKILEYVLKNFPQIENEAFKIKLSPELLNIEKQISQKFQQCNPKARKIIQERIPIKILHRLLLRGGISSSVSGMNSMKMSLSE